MSMNNTVCWVDLPALDLDRACRFYSAVLAKETRKESAGPGFEFGLFPHTENNVAGCLVRMPDYQPTATGPLIYFSVEGRLDDAIQAARDNGAKILQDKHQIGPHGHRAVLLDSEGNRIALHSKVA